MRWKKMRAGGPCSNLQASVLYARAYVIALLAKPKGETLS
jgi:hypothetical protein